jgi:RNA polymerase subunit RPABC4/transcription elongation factor Spt4
MKQCPDCSAQFSDDHLFCPTDGADLILIDASPTSPAPDEAQSGQVFEDTEELPELWDETENERAYVCDLCEHPIEQALNQCPHCGARRHGRWPSRKENEKEYEYEDEDDGVPFPYLVALLEAEQKPENAKTGPTDSTTDSTE